MDLPWAKRKREAVAAHGWSGSISKEVLWMLTGVMDLLMGLDPVKEEVRCLAGCPADMATAARSIAVCYMLISSQLVGMYRLG